MSVRTAPWLATIACIGLAGPVLAADPPRVTDAWARATPPGASVGAAYMTIEGGKQDDRLVDASSDRAAMVHLHSVEENDGVSRMRSIDEVAIPAGQRVMLAPKSTHVMLMGLDAPLVAGQAFVVTLRFAEAGDVPVTVTVRPATAPGDPAQQPH